MCLREAKLLKRREHCWGKVPNDFVGSKLLYQSGDPLVDACGLLIEFEAVLDPVDALQGGIVCTDET